MVNGYLRLHRQFSDQSGPDGINWSQVRSDQVFKPPRRQGFVRRLRRFSQMKAGLRAKNAKGTKEGNAVEGRESRVERKRSVERQIVATARMWMACQTWVSLIVSR